MQHPSPTRHLRVLLPLFGICVLALSSCQSDEERFALHVTRGDEYAAEGRRREAALEYMSALNIDPGSAEINERLAHLLTHHGATENAARYFLAAYNLDPSRIGAAMRGAQLVARTDRKLADEMVDAALERAPDEPIVQRTVAILAILDGETEKALAAARKAIDLDPEDPESWKQLGRVHMGRIQEARLARTPVSESVYLDAVEGFERADELQGGDVSAQIERARVLTAWKPHEEETQRAYEDALELAVRRGDRDEQEFAALAVALFGKQMKKPLLQERGLRAVLAIDPERMEDWRMLADLKGESVLKELIDERPNDPLAHQLYASWLISSDRTKEAIAHLTGVLADGLESPILWDELIRERLLRGQLKEAVDALEGLQEQSPDGPITVRARARIAIKTLRNDEAVDLLRGSSASASDRESQYLLALAEYHRGNLGDAGAAIDRSLALSEDVDSSALRLKARIHHDAEEWGLALQSFMQMAAHSIELSPKENLWLARTLYELGRRQAGRRQLIELLDDPEPSGAVAVEYARREGVRDPSTAMLHLQKALNRSMGNLKVLRAMTLLDRRAGETQQAVQRVDWILGRGFGGPATLLLRAELMADLGDLDRAESDALRAFEAAPALPAVDLLLEIFRAQGKLAEAQRSFDEAEAAGVLHAGARRLLARLYAEQGKGEEAVRMLERIVEENPRMVRARRDLALILAREGTDLERALTLAREANAKLKGEVSASFTLGYALYRKGRNEEALREYRRAIALDRDAGGRMAASLRYHLGLTLRAMNRNEQAAKAFTTALDLSPDFPEAEDARRQLEVVNESS